MFATKEEGDFSTNSWSMELILKCQADILNIGIIIFNSSRKQKITQPVQSFELVFVLRTILLSTLLLLLLLLLQYLVHIETECH